jgi:hypothetical protein
MCYLASPSVQSSHLMLVLFDILNRRVGRHLAVSLRGRTMMTGDHTSSTVTLEATNLLAHTGQVVQWLPTRETPRTDRHREVAKREQHLATETLSRGEILNLPVHVGRLHGSPLRRLLNRRVSELLGLYKRSANDGERHKLRKPSKFGAR